MTTTSTGPHAGEGDAYLHSEAHRAQLVLQGREREMRYWADCSCRGEASK